MTKTKPAAQKPPKHLRAATSQWWAEVVAEYDLDSHHIRLLTKAWLLTPVAVAAADLVEADSRQPCAECFLAVS